MADNGTVPHYYVTWGNPGRVGMIRRRDHDGRTRPVATVASKAEWDAFRDCIEAGYDEVDAVKELDR